MTQRTTSMVGGPEDTLRASRKFVPGDLCEYDGTPLPVTEDGEGDACPTCAEDLTEDVQ